ncbi:MAG: AAA family ATPase [Proteobacteria bacterium]|nr:AAA family ATPase [Pseudomonadota bacterium]
MQYIQRIIPIQELLQTKTVLLFGPRQTGKSSFVRNQLSAHISLSFNLLDQGFLLRLLADPTLIRKEIELKNLRHVIIFIDEIQKCPALMDEIHLMIEERGIRFLLTGSSARKLKKSGANLLGGRGRDRLFHPLVYPELIPQQFDLERALNNGLIPAHYLADDPDEDLASYVGRYLAEEIAGEGVSRNLPAFSRFLQIASTVNGQMINYTAVASDAQVSRATVQNWFQVLYDTLLAWEVPPFTKSVKRKAIETAKFYFFDTGVVRALRRLPRIVPQQTEWGEFFEQFIMMEMKTWIDYFEPLGTLHYWRSTSKFEVDFILNGIFAIEVKSTDKVSAKHLKGLKALEEEKICTSYIVVCAEDRPRLEEGIEVLPWQIFLTQLWQGRFSTKARK